MLFNALVALVAISAASAFRNYEPDTYFTRRDFKNWHDIFMYQGPDKWTTDKVWALKKMCEMVIQQDYRNPLDIFAGQEELDAYNMFDLKTKPYGRKHLREVQHCCNKVSLTEKKICFKEIRENYLDMFCDQGNDHVCCKNEFQNRYTCFGKNLHRVKFPRVVYDDREEIMAVEKPSLRRRNRRDTEFLDIEETVEERLKDLAKPEKHTFIERLDDMRNLKTRVATDSYGRMYDVAENLAGGEEGLLYDMERAQRLNPFDRFDKFDRFDRFDRLDRFDRFDKFDRLDRFDRFDQVEENLEILNENVFEGHPFEDRLEITEERLRHRRCPDSSRCMNEVEAMTDVAAQKVCTENFVKSERHEVESCCRAGALVGKTVGRKHRQVCVPAVFNLQRKVHGCVLDRQQCKQAFVQCCHERAERARDERVLEKDLTREIVREELEDPTMMFDRRLEF